MTKNILHKYSLESKPNVTKEEFDRIVSDFVQLLLWQGMLVNKVRVDPLAEPSSEAPKRAMVYNAYIEAEGSVMGNILRRTLKAATIKQLEEEPKDE